uniref:Uncharacterized protein n=1 Tax=Arundo donax TaxID=35708 RepID=A0A0A8ZP00_ARUDO
MLYRPMRSTQLIVCWISSHSRSSPTLVITQLQPAS